jgi:transglutaminase-like putative cysteine protease
MPSPELRALRPLAWCIGAFLGGVLLHVQRVPVWTSTAAVGCAAWSMAAAIGLVRLPGRVLKSILALALTAAILAMFHTLNGLTAGTALLVVMGSIKLLEATRRRDQYVIVGASLVLLLAACLQQQRLGFVPLYLVHAWICACALLAIAHPRSSLGARAAASLAARSLLYAVPLALVLFLFFPRLAGALWSVPRSGQAVTGLSDTMTPSSIAELTDSPDPAFRVWFEGDVPPPQERYWRGPVLHRFNGLTWSVGPRRFAPPAPLETLGPAYRYRVQLEPSEQRWLFALDTVDAVVNVESSAAERVVITFDHQLIGSEPVMQQLTYEARSHVRTRALEPLEASERGLDTDPRQVLNPRSLALGRRLRAEAGDESAFVQRVLEFFRTGGFEYTLTPPELGLDPVDDFLFSTRRGFCGHFASAFVTLMRAGGIPARVVTGYLGGEWRLFPDPAVGRARLGRDLAHRDRLGACRPDRNRGTRAAAARHLRSAARCALRACAADAPGAVASHRAAGVGCGRCLVERALRRIQSEITVHAPSAYGDRYAGLGASWSAARSRAGRMARVVCLEVRQHAATTTARPARPRLHQAVRQARRCRTCARTEPRAARLRGACASAAAQARARGRPALTTLCGAALRCPAPAPRRAQGIRARGGSAALACSRVSRNSIPGQRSSVSCRLTREGAR